MQDKPKGAGYASATTAAEDDRDQRAVLIHVLEEDSPPLTLTDLIRELAAGDEEFTEQDRIARAIRELIAVGLLHRSGDLVLPTRAAVRFYELEAL
ncbi:MAG: hypothetical protein ACTHN3_14320 [Solirubrobacterales bacterium]